MPTTNALQNLLTASQLRRSWRELFYSTRTLSRNTAGTDGVTLNDFSIDPKGEIRTLLQTLKRGAFDFSPLKAHPILKPNGKYRLICVPTVRDRIVQRTLLRFLSDRYGHRLANRISYGFIKGRGVQEAAKEACKLRTKHPWVLKTDICSFFDRIDREILKSAVKRLVRERSLHGILEGAIDCEIGPLNRVNRKIVENLGIAQGCGVRQGMPLSPFFSNVILGAFDYAIQDRGIPAVRYADDLIFFSTSEDGCKQILDVCRHLLDKLKLEIPLLTHGSKTVIYPPADAAEFLGLGICKLGDRYSLRLLDNQRDTIRKRILEMGSTKELLARGITLASLGQSVSNRIAGYVSAYDCCDNIVEFENALERLRVKVLRQIYTKELKIPLEELSAEARTFLNL